jgi:hypothetical protein
MSFLVFLNEALMDLDEVYCQIGRIAVAHNNLQSTIESSVGFLTTDWRLINMLYKGKGYAEWARLLRTLIEIRLQPEFRDGFFAGLKVADAFNQRRNELIHADWLVFLFREQDETEARDRIAFRPRRFGAMDLPMKRMTGEDLEALKEVERGLSEAQSTIHLAFVKAYRGDPGLREWLKADQPTETRPAVQ